ncbi:MAG: M20/M25/M40 family metallo-hydrolase [Pyrinomonadaceae bacterium]|nr:M20/M25/M40 family metallo-hydrolase [Pyrinomonadaceae bacterium]
MIRRPCAAVVLIVVLFCPWVTLAQQPTGIRLTNQLNAQTSQQATATPTPDPNDPIARIKEEGLKRSQVMETLSYLTDVIGPRLTGSPNMKRANEWTRDQLTKWGLQNAHLEPWGPFGRGWVLKEFSAQVTEPQAIPLIAYPKAWSPGANIPRGEVVYIDAKDEGDLARFKGKLRGKIVLAGAMREVKAHFDPQGKRLTEKDLLSLADAGDPSAPGAGVRLADPGIQEFIKSRIFAARALQFISAEGAALVIYTGEGDGGTIFVDGAVVPHDLDMSSPIAAILSLFFSGPQPYDENVPPIVPQIVLAVEQYNRLARMIQAGEKLQMKVAFDVQFSNSDLMAYNTVAEIPGSDKADEIVMIGGHMDSWHAGTGATDNGAGVAAAMEAVRIIQALGLKPRRTIRIGLWSGEEQGLYGSLAYVAKHLGQPAEDSKQASFLRMVQGGTAKKITRGPEYDKLSAYYNLDNGTGKIRGVYLQGNEGVRSIFREWLQPFRDLGASTLTAANTSGTDHVSFDAIGLPGFQFIQDQIEYDSRTHHSNQDVFDRIQSDDLKQAATIMAAFIYQTAMREEKLPRKKAPGQ